MSRNVYTIPSGVAFLKALAQGLLARHPVAGDPFALASVTVFLPTRRALRALEEAFLDLLAVRGQAALLMPRMRALGDGDEEEIVLSADAASAELDLPPAVPVMHRRVRLAQLLMKGPRAMPFAEALGWAKSLARFLDEALIEEVDLERLAEVIPEELARHFQSSRAFLHILTDHWPGILAADGYIEATERRARLMDAEVKAWQKRPPQAIYIAGSTGSIPSTARLMAAALALPQGALILPGLDRGLDQAAWDEVGDTHPQFGLKRLLERLEVERADIADWPYTDGLQRPAPERVRLLAEALKPAPTTDSWARSLAGGQLGAALAGLKLAIGRDQAEEARIIALAMRQAVERPKQSAMLVTPDRRLARRVCAELKRWDIVVDDSAGVPLAQTQGLILLRLLIDTVLEDWAPISLLALLKHPLVRLGFKETRFATVRARLESVALRGPRPAAGAAGLRARLKDVRLDKERRSPGDGRRPENWPTECYDLIDRIERALAPLMELSMKGRAPSSAWAAALVQCAGQVADAASLWRGDDGEAAADLVHALGELLPESELSLGEFRRLLDAATEERVVRPRARIHPRLAILGPLEARLQSADLVILGGLNEGIWPAHADVDAWANRPMRKALEMSAPERRIGLAAHDFQELAAAPRVLLTASDKVEGSPALRSRWLMRLDNFLAGRAAREHLAPEPYFQWARALDAPRAPRAAERPAPKPPRELRPRKFSITEITKLRRDPYAIFAKRILRLRRLDPIDADNTAQARGIAFHRVFERFCATYPDALPDRAFELLIDIGEHEIGLLGLDPEASKLWTARLGRAARALIDWETERRISHRVLAVEASGEILLPVMWKPVALTGRIDRIDADRATGALTIIDYKTGSAPSPKQIMLMLDPQLPLGGLLARKGMLEGVEAQPVDTLLYLGVGGASGKTERSPIREGVDELISSAEAGLIARLNQFDDPSTPYYSWAMPQTEKDKGDYDLLARVKEWRIDTGEPE